MAHFFAALVVVATANLFGEEDRPKAGATEDQRVMGAHFRFGKRRGAVYDWNPLWYFTKFMSH